MHIRTFNAASVKSLLYFPQISERQNCGRFKGITSRGSPFSLSLALALSFPLSHFPSHPRSLSISHPQRLFFASRCGSRITFERQAGQENRERALDTSPSGRALYARQWIRLSVYTRWISAHTVSAGVGICTSTLICARMSLHLQE